MKLHLPKILRIALLATLALVAQPAMAAVTYDNLTSIVKDTDNNVYYNGQGTFYVDSAKTTTLQLTIDLASLKSYQHSNDYSTVYNGTSTFVTWSYNNDNSWGLADYWETPQQDMNYAGYGSEARLTGYWNSSAWNPKKAASGSSTYYATYDTLSQYATNGKLTMTITNTPVSNGGIKATCLDASGNTVTLYNGSGLYDSTVTNTRSYTVNLNYVTAVTLETDSTLDVSTFKEPLDYSKPYVSERWNARDKSSLGRVLFAGDSITHGVADMTWRWQMFKTFQDNDIENEIAGPRIGYSSDPNTSDYQGNTTTYGGVEFNNAHLAQSSGRTHNIVTGSNAGSGVNYGGWSTAKTAAAYDADTIVCLMGTNDILSDGGSTTNDYCTKFAKMLGGAVSYENNKYEWSQQGEAANNYDRWGTFGKMVGDLSKQERDTVYIMSVPCWTTHANSNTEPYHQAAMQFNTLLEEWTKQYGKEKNKNVVFVDVNKGLIDPTETTSFFGNAAFFRDPGTAYGKDGLHPNEQGSLIIAGNLARGMGLAGRTAGLKRSASNAAGWTSFTEASVSLSAGQSRQLLHDVFIEDGGYTIDFGAVFGNGADGGWLDTSNALSVSVGDGSNSGTLNLSEGYIMWGNSVLFCQDNSLSGNESLRIAYHNGNAEDNVASGYYVWLGDMLIGQGLSNQAGTAINGVAVTATGATGTLSNLSYTNTAYAPTTSFTVGSNPYLVTQTAGNTELIHTPEMLPVLDNHDNAGAKGLGVDFSGAGTAASGATAVNSSSPAGEVVVTMTSSGNYYGAVQDFTRASGDVTVNVTGGTAANNAFGVVNGSLTDGNVTMVFSNGVTVKSGTYGSTTGAFMGAFRGNIGGSLNVEVQNATLNGGIYMGVVNTTSSNSIGSVNLVVGPGATVNGDIQGGSTVAGGTINGDINLTVNGGHVTGNIVGSGTAGTVKGDIAITVTGGIIDGSITAKQSSGVTYANGKTGTVTVEGNLASIGGSITADTVNLKNVAQSEYSDTFDKYKGNINASTVVLDNYTADAMGATLKNGVNLTVKNGTDTALTQNAAIGTMNVEAGTKIAFDGGKHTVTNLFADDQSAAKSEVTLKNNAQVSATNLRIGAQGETYSVQDGSALTIAGNNIKIEAAAEGGVAGLSTNRGPVNGYYTYALGSDVFVLDDAKVTISSNTAELKNVLHQSSVVVDKEGSTITVSNSGNTLTALTAQQGNLVVTNASGSKATLGEISAVGGNVDIRDLGSGASVSLKDLVIGASRTVTALTSGTTVNTTESNVASVVMTGKLNAASGAVLNANLTMAAGSTLQVAAGGLEMGCSLTLEKGINLGDDQLTTLTTTGSLTLFTGVDSLTLADGISGTTEAITMEQGISAGTYFNLPSTLDAATADPYVLVYSGAADGGVLSLALATPEPATATLSLLALAGLAARRRRK